MNEYQLDTNDWLSYNHGYISIQMIGCLITMDTYLPIELRISALMYLGRAHHKLISELYYCKKQTSDDFL